MVTRNDRSGCWTQHPAKISIRKGFTLVELLVVIAIIVLLLGVAITVGRSVTNSGRARATEHILRTLDAGLSGDIAAKDGPPGAYYLHIPDPNNPNSGFMFPIVDGRAETRNLPIPSPWPQPASGAAASHDRVFDPAQPSFSLLLMQSGEDSQLARAVQTLDAKFVTVQVLPVHGWAASLNPSTRQWEATGALRREMIRMTVVSDGFGHPIRAVHPAAAGGSGPYFSPDSGNMVTRGPLTVNSSRTASSSGVQGQFVRSYRGFNPNTVQALRAVGDADEGRPVGNRPYLYSVGPDGDPGTRKDNVYVTVPSFETETRNFPTPMN